MINLIQKYKKFFVEGIIIGFILGVVVAIVALIH